jgi:HSP20 family molecular chaperone IbpA
MPRGTAVRYHHLEFSYGDFERVFRLPVAIDEAHVEAACSDGLLTVKIKKTKRPEGIHVSIRG